MALPVPYVTAPLLFEISGCVSFDTDVSLSASGAGLGIYNVRGSGSVHYNQFMQRSAQYGRLGDVETLIRLMAVARLAGMGGGGNAEGREEGKPLMQFLMDCLDAYRTSKERTTTFENKVYCRTQVAELQPNTDYELTPEFQVQ
jgi:hypothetical protein